MTVARAFLFPGQGAQATGMGADLADRCPEARRVFDRGREILGVDVLEICRNGPPEELNSTRISQPAIFLHSMAVLETLGRLWGAPGPLCRGVPAVGSAGLSLGEYSALVFAGSLEFDDAVRIVGLRGALMQRACDQARGAMAAVIGFPADDVEKVVAAARSEGLEIGVANYNAPEQTVISGEVGALEVTENRLHAAGARRVLRLNVTGAFHSPLMAPATRELEPVLREVRIQPPRVPFYANVTGGPVEDPEMIREGLIRQVESPVRWKQIAAALVESGMEGAFEVGPGKVIAGLLRSARKGFETVSLGTWADVQAASGLRLEGESRGADRGQVRNGFQPAER